MTTMPENCRVLVVEDESAVLMLMEDMLSDLGVCEVVSAMGLAEALPLAQTLELTFAVLDVNLGEERSFPVAQALRARGVPFFFATGYGSSGIEGDFVGSTVLKKPFRQAELVAAIDRTLAAAA